MTDWRRALRPTHPWITALAAVELVFLTLPTLIILVTSFGGGEAITFPPETYSLRWYAHLPTADQYLHALVNSVSVALVCTAIAIPVGISTALGLIRYDIRFENAVQVYLLLPFTVPLVVSGVILLVLFGEMGLVGQQWPIGVALAVINLPFMIWSVAASVNALDPNLEHAARSLGAEDLQTFRYVTLPSLLPGVVSGALLMFVLALNEFIVSLFLTTPETVTLPVKIYSSIRGNVSPFVAVVSTIYIVVAVVAIVVADRVVGLERFLHS
ncbi:MAG: ABC transporter permease [Haloarculaceae archaeon]